jgi:peptide/nickel transport system permease protein
MLSLVIRKLLTGLVTLWLVSILIFAGTEILPGDVASAILGPERTPEALQAIRKNLELDQPPTTRYVKWLSQFVHGDLGKSLVSGSAIAPEVRRRLSNTAFLAGVAACISIPLSISLGLLSVIRRSGFVDKLINAVALMTISTPEFLVAYALIVMFSVRFRLFPSLALIGDTTGFWERLYIVILPAGTIVLTGLAYVMRLTRAAIVSVLSSPYIEMAILKGVPWRRIDLRHALPNALAPIINVVALNLAYLIAGVVVVEVVFVYPGMGQLMVDSVSKRDVPVVQACGLIFASTYVVLNMVADLLVVISNPRLRHPR